MRTEILLHGCFHARVGSNQRLPWLRRLRSRRQSAGEDEFFSLDGSAAEDRVRLGAGILDAAFGQAVRTFVPPAWAGDAQLRDILRRRGFVATEDHLWLYDLRAQRRMFSPAVAFATRTPWRSRLSIAWARLITALPAGDRIVRLAVHPPDWQSPVIRARVLDTVAAMAGTHRWMLYGEIFGPAAEAVAASSRSMTDPAGASPRTDAS
jgi:predicted deacetylase